MCVNTYHIFFIHLSVDGCLGCFHVLAIINGAVMNIGAYVSFRIRVFIFSRYMPRGGIGGSYGDSIFSFLFFFKGAYILFSIVAAPIYIPNNSVGRFPFLYSLSSIYYL